MKGKGTWALLICGAMLGFSGCGRTARGPGTEAAVEKTYAMTDAVVLNPYIGFAVEATNTAVPDEHSLVYIDITFAELQPEGPDSFDFASIERKNNLAFWRSQGKHAVLRFICDLPGEQPHMDIPQWLYDLTADGDFYDISYGKGYSPNYSNQVFLTCHREAIAALGQYFSDGFVSYVQLGSLGHWGEWHVLYSAGIQRLPDSRIRQQYVSHYMDAFPDARLLMRRPFTPAAENGFGLYNDMTGHRESTREWLSWIENGGQFTQTNEPDAMTAIPDFWKTAPVGGEFTSSLPMWYICGLNLRETLSLLEASHTSFLGPKCPVRNEYDGPLYRYAVPKILNRLGYRLGITKMTFRPQTGVLTLQWENHGSAPIYFETPVKLYLTDAAGSTRELTDVQIDLTALLPGETAVSATELPKDVPLTGATLSVGLLDPMTKTPAITLVSNQPQLHPRLFTLHEFPQTQP